MREYATLNAKNGGTKEIFMESKQTFITAV